MLRTHELLELACLDALGLLDKADRAEFEEAFAAAPETLKAQIRREQARVAGWDSLLPKVSPPRGLRQRVLELILGPGQADAPVRHEGGREGPAIMPSRGVAKLWRTGAIAFGAAAMVLGYATLLMQREFDHLSAGVVSGANQEALTKSLGASYEDLLRRGETVHFQLASDITEVPSDADTWAALQVNTKEGTGRLLIGNLPEDVARVRIVIERADGSTVLVEPEVTRQGERMYRDLKNLNLANGDRFEIQSLGETDSDMRSVLRSDVIMVDRS